MTKIKDLAEKMRLVQPLLIKEVKNGTTAKGAPYLTVTVSDDTGMIEGKFWDVKPEDVENIHVGQVAMVSFEVLDYKNNLQLRINRIEALDQKTVDLNAFATASSTPLDARQKKVRELV